MRLLTVLFILLAVLLCVPEAQAGPLCALGRAGLHAAAAPLKLVGKARANRKEARQERRAGRGC